MHDWKEVDRVLVGLARQRSGQDYEEGIALLAAKRTRAYAHFGFGSLVEYIERRLGYDPRTTNERLRVAEALEVLPGMAASLRGGEIRWSTARELTRIAQPATEGEWLAAAQAKTLRQIEQLVAGLRPGDRPGAPSDPDLIVHVLRLELKAADFAMARGMLDVIKKRLGEPGMSDADALVAGLRSLAGASPAGAQAESIESTDVAPYQTGTIRCDDCKRMWMEDRGERVALAATAAERIACDEQNIGALDGSTPARATQTIPPATRRLVRRRSAGACEVPGCRHRFGLEIHHLTMRSDFGTHDLDNLVDLCGIHHGRFHEGLLLIEGKPSTGLRFAHADGTAYGHAVRPERLQNRADAFSALQNMGYRESEVRAALAQIDADAQATLGELVKRALKVLSPGAAAAPAKSYVMRTSAGDGTGVVREEEAAWWSGGWGDRAHVGSARHESLSGWC